MLLAAGASPEPVDHRTYLNGAWNVVSFPKDDDCVAGAQFNGSNLSIHWLPRIERLGVFIDSPDFESIVDGREYQLKLYFLIGERELDDGWGTVTATGRHTAGGVPGISFIIKGDEALRDFARARAVSLFRNDKIVISLSLDKSDEAIAALRRCAADVVREHPIDPFAD